MNAFTETPSWFASCWQIPLPLYFLLSRMAAISCPDNVNLCMLWLHFFVLHLQSHIAEQEPIPDGGNLTILQMWEQAGLLPPNMVNKTIGNQMLHTGTVLLVVVPYIRNHNFRESPSISKTKIHNFCNFTWSHNLWSQLCTKINVCSLSAWCFCPRWADSSYWIQALIVTTRRTIRTVTIAFEIIVHLVTENGTKKNFSSKFVQEEIFMGRHWKTFSSIANHHNSVVLK